MDPWAYISAAFRQSHSFCKCLEPMIGHWTYTAKIQPSFLVSSKCPLFFDAILQTFKNVLLKSYFCLPLQISRARDKFDDSTKLVRYGCKKLPHKTVSNTKLKRTSLEESQSWKAAASNKHICSSTFFYVTFRFRPTDDVIRWRLKIISICKDSAQFGSVAIMQVANS